MSFNSMFSNSETYSDHFLNLTGFDFNIFSNAAINYVSLLSYLALVLHGLTKIFSLPSNYDYVINVFSGAIISIAIIVAMFTVGLLGLIGMTYSYPYALIGFFVLFGLMYSGEFKKLLKINKLAIILIPTLISYFFIYLMMVLR